MFIKSSIICLHLFLLFEVNSGAARFSVPNDFLSTLFNSSFEDVMKLARNFRFCEVEPVDIKFYSYTRSQPEPLELNRTTRMSLNNGYPTKVIVHGWFGSSDADFIKDIANEYHKRGDYNIIGVDWSKDAHRDYLHSSCSARDVGKSTANFIIEAVGNDTSLLNNIHLIGHSLGAQVSGLAGKEVKSRIHSKIGRITALDAAAPLFEYPIKMPEALRISSEDATYVDGIHTNTGFFGFAAPFASADYYVGDGNPIQPGCEKFNFFEGLVCSHSISHYLFQESIISRKFLAQQCNNPILFLAGLCNKNRKIIMGEDAPTNISGSYFLATKSAILPKRP